MQRDPALSQGLVAWRAGNEAKAANSAYAPGRDATRPARIATGLAERDEQHHERQTDDTDRERSRSGEGTATLLLHQELSAGHGRHNTGRSTDRLRMRERLRDRQAWLLLRTERRVIVAIHISLPGTRTTRHAHLRMQQALRLRRTNVSKSRGAARFWHASVHLSHG